MVVVTLVAPRFSGWVADVACSDSKLGTGQPGLMVIQCPPFNNKHCNSEALSWDFRSFLEMVSESALSKFYYYLD